VAPGQDGEAIGGARSAGGHRSCSGDERRCARLVGHGGPAPRALAHGKGGLASTASSCRTQQGGQFGQRDGEVGCPRAAGAEQEGGGKELRRGG
jgi:hypothetical protein